MFILILLALLGSAPAHAKEDVIFFLNMNYSSQELGAVERVAKRRGQRVEVIPPREMIPMVESLFKEKFKLEKRIKELRPEYNSAQVKNLVSDYMRNGIKAKGDPLLNDQLYESLQSIQKKTMEVNRAELKLGSLEDLIRKRVKEIEARGSKIDAFITSSHSDGINLTGETSIRLSSASITRLSKTTPKLFRDPRHVLLLGCYNMTETNHFRWRNALFPSASLIGGFGVKAPSRYREISQQYIEEILDAADELDRQNGDSGQVITKDYLDKVFRSLASVKGTSSAVIDYCRHIIEGKPGARNLSCEDQWNAFRGRSQEIQAEYLDPRNPTKDPSLGADEGELRLFYNELQRLCRAHTAPQMARDEVAAAERYRTVIRETLIRLIHWWDVQKNFSTYFSRDLQSLAQTLREAGVGTPLPKLDGTFSRVEFVKRHHAISQELQQRRDELESNRSYSSSRYGESYESDFELSQINRAKEEFRLLEPLLFLEGEDSVGDGNNSRPETTLAKGGIPFNWITTGTVVGPRRSK